MPRSNRNPPGGLVYHVLNRGNDKKTLFFEAADYAAFLDVVMETQLIRPIRLIDYCLMPNHWHFILWPAEDGELAEFMHQMTTTHANRWNAFHNRTGEGHVYQGPYKYFAVESDSYYFTACRYVVRNAQRAGLTPRAESWPWCSLADRQPLQLDPGPLAKPSDWVEWVNTPCTSDELKALRRSRDRGVPFGSSTWTRETARLLGMEHTLRGVGRPRKPASRKF